MLKTAGPVVLNIAKTMLQPQQPPDKRGEQQPEQPEEGQSHGVGIATTIQSLSSNMVDVAYKFDDFGEWSQPKSYPTGNIEVLVPDSDFTRHCSEGKHIIAMRFQEENITMGQDSLEYVINSAPVIQATNTDTMSFNGVPSRPVTLPFSVLDGDGDNLSLWYRFNGKGDWAYVSAESGLGPNVLPVEAFSGREVGSNGFIEVVAYDGYDHSNERLQISYSIEAEGEKHDAFFGSLSPAAFAGIIIAAVAIIALAITIILLAMLKKPKSSSTGLIESE
jgi:hypothetical protein